MEKFLNIAVVGATGLVGQKIVEVIRERDINANLYLFSSTNETKEIKIADKNYKIQKIDLNNLPKLDYALFAVEANIAKDLAPEFIKRGIIVIDNSNAFRRRKSVPLIVPQVNADCIKKNSKLISNPNCSTIQLVTILKPLDKKFKIKRVVVSTYQAVSGAGQNGILDYINNTQTKFDYPIKDNLIPQIDIFLPNGYTREEDKLIFESRKILSHHDLQITATAVRVPVLNCHSESVNIEFEKNVSVNKIIETLKHADNVILEEDLHKFPMPIFCDGRDEVFVGRIRKDSSKPNCYNMWIVADNLRRGAASNAVDILQCMEQKKIH